MTCTAEFALKGGAVPEGHALTEQHYTEHDVQDFPHFPRFSQNEKGLIN